jgi:hypothetical protein
LFTNGAVEFSEDPECEHISREMWICAGMLETCEGFEEFENAAFGMSGIGGKPCADNLYEFAQTCNG